MKHFISVFLGLLLTVGAGAVLAATAAAPTTFMPDSLHWVAGNGPTKGSSLAVLVGDPTKSGTAIIRVKMPDGYTNQPHYHSHPEYITVLQGAVLFGVGDTINKASAKILPAGSFIMVPTGVHHWSIAKGETLVQVGGEGPLNNIPIKHSAM